MLTIGLDIQKGLVDARADPKVVLFARLHRVSQLPYLQAVDKQHSTLLYYAAGYLQLQITCCRVGYYCLGLALLPSCWKGVAQLLSA